MLHFKCPAENQTGLLIEIATSLSVLEQNLILLGVGICIEIVHTTFRDPRWKIVVLATLESRVPKNSFFSKKSKLCSFFGAIFFHLGSRNFVYTLPNHTVYLTIQYIYYLTTAKKLLLYHTQGGGNSSTPGYRYIFFNSWKRWSLNFC